MTAPGSSPRAEFCVLCGKRRTAKNGLVVCTGSELDLSHLWAVEGHVEPWFKFASAGRANG